MSTRATLCLLLAQASAMRLTTPTMTATAPCGFIGLGIMGEGMARQLIDAGTPLHVWSRNRAVCERVAEYGGSVVIHDSPAAVVGACERTYLMLSTPEACEEVYEMAGGVLEGVAAGKQLVDCATLRAADPASGRPADMASLAERVRARGGAFAEAPVSGSKGPAWAGSLVFMVAGERSVYDASTAELAAMGKHSVYVGEEVGLATQMKLVVNMIMGTQLAALAEGVALTERLGLKVDDMQAVLNEGAMASPMVALKGPLMANKGYDAAFPLKYALKDLRFALAAAEAAGLGVPVSAAATERYVEADEALQLGESDFCAVAEVARKSK